MATKDKLVYFDVYARGEPIRMLYAVAGKELDDKIVGEEEWPTVKEGTPLGQLPTFECEKGTLVMSNSIARYVAKKFGLSGGSIWEEALNDMVVETSIDCFEAVTKKIYLWMLFKMQPEPEDSTKIKEEVKGIFVKSMNFIQSVAEKRGKKFIIDDKVSLADVWLFNTLQFSRKAFPDMMELTPWVKQFTERMESDASLKKYLESRPASKYEI
ncbi:probable glutathione S-transferase 8 [Watersipora subatra]|uniref:probable glutathione S-transferase 8 n=1 Tax=Watersipora subatra TaxID=2589382 RepID=UPI00355C4FC3